MGKIKHNGCKEHPKLYSMWLNMKARCKYKCTDSYERYGGRGIKVCHEWENDFIKFRDFALANGYEFGLIIDRINNNGNYEESNIRFVNAQQSSLNRSTRSDSITGVLGVRYRERNTELSKYTAVVWIDGKDVNVGSFPTLEQAQIAREKYIKCQSK